jgi:hypothetical protein
MELIRMALMLEMLEAATLSRMEFITSPLAVINFCVHQILPKDT